MANQHVEIVSTEPKHIRELGNNLRVKDHELSKRYGMKADRALWRAYKNSLYTRTAVINGKVSAIWGVLGVHLGETGRPWLSMSRSLASNPTRIAFCYRREVNAMLKFFPSLVDYVDIRDEKTLRMLKILGFTCGEVVDIGKKGNSFVQVEKK